MTYLHLLTFTDSGTFTDVGANVSYYDSSKVFLFAAVCPVNSSLYMVIIMLTFQEKLAAHNSTLYRNHKMVRYKVTVIHMSNAFWLGILVSAHVHTFHPDHQIILFVN